jgi:ABC-type Zn uptake system ZnuABC Zn-binding protein ZnuA
MKTSTASAAGVMIVAMLACLVGCKKTTPTAAGQVEIAVANSYLGAIVRDLCGDTMPVFDLAPPGMCPGHFDMTPSQASRLYQARVLLVFDFQSNVAGVFDRKTASAPTVITLKPGPGMCIPQTYLTMLDETAEALGKLYPDKQEQFQRRQAEIKERLAQLEQGVKARIEQAELTGLNVLTSHHQAEFVHWLGLNPVDTFAGSDTETAAQVNQNLINTGRKPIALIIANQQEGTQLAQAMAGHLAIKMAVLSNFPQGDASPAFDALVTRNVNALIEAVR